MISWGRDEYIHQVMHESNLPEEGLAMLRSKSDDVPDVAALRPYYLGLIDKYLPAKIRW